MLFGWLSRFVFDEKILSRCVFSMAIFCRLVSAVFRLSELEKQMGEAKLTHVLSPTLSSTIAWFLQTWASSYLLLPEAQNSEVLWHGNGFF